MIIFDIDGTLVDRDSTELLPGRKHFFQSLEKGVLIALASNQGGPACRNAGWDWSNKYPTLDDVENRLSIIKGIIEEAASRMAHLYTSLIFIDKGGKIHIPKEISEKDPRLNIEWRKPAPGMLNQAMKDLGVPVRYVTMIGDRAEDAGAAKAAGCNFFYTNDFVWEDF